MSDVYPVPISPSAEDTPKALKEAAIAEAEAIADAASLEHRQRLFGASGGYRILQELGKGGNSSVYLVEAISGPFRGVLFALKIFLRISDDVRRERFDTEIRFLQGCNHPSILRVFDQGNHYVQVDGVPRILPFVVAEYLPKTLRSAMLSGLSMLEKTAYTLQLVGGLAYLASRNPLIIHRDIKPENIFVKGKSAVFGDFGLLKAGDGLDPSVEYHIQASSGVRFPRMYPTPDLVEYCKARENPLPLSPKSDVFQLGLVIAELFTTSFPLKPRSAPFSSIELVDLGRVPGAQGDAIQALIKRMLEIDTLKRPNAADLFDPWEGIFLNLVDLAQQLEGRVFGDS